MIWFNIKKARPKQTKNRIFDDAYGTFVSKSDVEKVKRAILHCGFDYKPDAASIASQTGLSIFRTRATLHLMKSEGMITSEKVGDNFKKIFQKR